MKALDCLGLGNRVKDLKCKLYLRDTFTYALVFGLALSGKPCFYLLFSPKL